MTSVARHTSHASPRRRIGALDGLRAIAVVGVLYAHVWSFGLGTPPLRAIGFDINRALSVFGTGVDLFFVISGFCMHLMYGRKAEGFSLPAFRTFVANRFRRIAPAFYAAVVLSALLYRSRNGRFPTTDVVAHATFIFTLVPSLGRLAASFWSLATEWHFYLILPAIFVAARRTSTPIAVALAITLSCSFRLATTTLGLEGHGITVDHLILSRLVEFAWGILAAHYYVTDRPMPAAFRGLRGFGLAWGVALLGRSLMTDRAIRLHGVGPWLEAASVPILSLGFMLVVWNSVTERHAVVSALESGPARWVGKVSYSLYLWHWDVGLGLVAVLRANFGAGALTPILYSLLALAVLLPLSALSYRLFEAPYFGRTQKSPS